MHKERVREPGCQLCVRDPITNSAPIPTVSMPRIHYMCTHAAACRTSSTTPIRLQTAFSVIYYIFKSQALAHAYLQNYFVYSIVAHAA